MIRLGVALAILATPSFAQAIFVDDSATGAANGSSWHDAFTDLQNAFLVSSQGDQIWVAVGTYRPGPPAGNRDTPFAIPDGVALYGGFDATEATLAERGLDLFEQTLLSGDLNGNDGPGFVGVSDNSYHVVATGVLANPTTLDGFLIMGGNANGPGSGEQDGGGLTTSGSLIVRNVVFRENRADGDGGGVFVSADANPKFEDSSFEGNLSLGDGGGVHQAAGNLTLRRCSFHDNVAGDDGGGLAAADRLFIEGSFFRGNLAEDSGGAVFSDGAVLDIRDTVFQLNDTGTLLSGFGGAINNALGSGSLKNCLFIANTAMRGGGINSSTGLSPDGGFTFSADNCTFYGNQASGALAGGGIYSTSAGFKLRSSILWENVGPGGTDFGGQFAGVGGLADNTCIQSMSDSEAVSLGVGNISDSPLFADPDGEDDVLGTIDDNLRLTRGSPSIDAGTNDAVIGLDHDVDGLPRLVDDPETVDTGTGTGALVDLGAYEYHTFVGDLDEISLSAGGFSTLSLTAGKSEGGNLYIVLGSFTGTSPGLSLEGHTLPLNFDAYFLKTLNEIGVAPLFQSFGFLDGAGEADALFWVHFGADPILAGVTMQHAYAVLDSSTLEVRMTSTPFAIDLIL